jgi:hypothetical protein
MKIVPLKLKTPARQKQEFVYLIMLSTDEFYHRLLFIWIKFFIERKK